MALTPPRPDSSAPDHGGTLPDHPEARRVEVAVLSDLHLGTPACRAESLLAYLTRLRPRLLILAGDVIDLAAGGGYWPESHLRILRKLLKFVVHGVPVYYITGNHDAGLRRYAGLGLGGLHLVRSLDLELGGRRFLVIHGDQCDAARTWWGRLRRSLGGLGYSLLLFCDNQFNRLRRVLGARPVSLSPFLLQAVGGIRRYITSFATAARAHARAAGYDGVICGHIHRPQCEPDDGACRYLNCGDWIQHCTALEFDGADWHLHQEPAALRAAPEEPGTLGAAHRLVSAA